MLQTRPTLISIHHGMNNAHPSPPFLKRLCTFRGDVGPHDTRGGDRRGDVVAELAVGRGSCRTLPPSADRPRPQRRPNQPADCHCAATSKLCNPRDESIVLFLHRPGNLPLHHPSLPGLPTRPICNFATLFDFNSSPDDYWISDFYHNRLNPEDIWNSSEITL